MKTCLLITVLALSFVDTVAQNGVVLRLQTNLPEALVYADSVPIGRASSNYFLIPRSTRLLRLVPSNSDSWSIIPIWRELTFSTGDTLSLELNFPHHYKVESVPFGAEVVLETPEGRSRLGDTPLLHTADSPLRGMLFVHKEGFESQRLTPGDEVWNHHQLALKILEEGSLTATDEVWIPERPKRKWITYVAASTALVSGVLAVHYKLKADRRYDRYALSGDPTLRGGFVRLDRNAAIALGTMQVGLGVLAIRLIIN